AKIRELTFQLILAPWSVTAGLYAANCSAAQAGRSDLSQILGGGQVDRDADYAFSVFQGLTDLPMEKATRCQRLPEREQVLWTVVSLKRFCDRVLTALYATMTEPS